VVSGQFLHGRYSHPGDAPEVLVAMDPAALKANLSDLQRGGRIIVNTDNFTKATSRKPTMPATLEDGSLQGYEVHKVPSPANHKALEVLRR
jgi:2-oxoglutarate ferredoxin oxidoreductase subunit alpha